MSTLIIDSFEFCRLKESRSGQLPVTDMSRLAQEVVGASAGLVWSLQGGADQFGHAQLLLEISGSVQLACQRCLAPLDVDISSTSRLIVAKDEVEADHIDELLSDDEVDVIVGSKAMLISDLIEDEALLSIPLAVKHDVCPADSAASYNAGKKPSAFDVLKELKR
jgi:uncharacterized protein